MNLLADKLLIFTYIVGEMPIIVDNSGGKRRIGRQYNGRPKPIEERAGDLSLLSVKSIGAASYTHNKLFNITESIRSIMAKSQ